MKSQPMDIGLSSEELSTLIFLRHRGGAVVKPGKPIARHPVMLRLRMKAIETLIARGLVTERRSGVATFYEAVESATALPKANKAR